MTSSGWDHHGPTVTLTLKSKFLPKRKGSFSYILNLRVPHKKKRKTLTLSCRNTRNRLSMVRRTTPIGVSSLSPLASVTRPQTTLVRRKSGFGGWYLWSGIPRVRKQTSIFWLDPWSPPVLSPPTGRRGSNYTRTDHNCSHNTKYRIVFGNL